MSPSDPAEKLLQLILESELEFSTEEVAGLASMTVEDANKLWRALGFPDTSPDDVAYGQLDLDALRIVKASLDSGILDESTILRMTRALGSTMSRLADWQVATLVDHIETQVASGPATSRLDSALGLAQTVGPTFERLILYAWRRHLAAAVERVQALGAKDIELLAHTVTVGFADLVRFTALSNGMDDSRLAELVEKFEAEVNDLITSGGGRSIKSLGDAVLFVADDPETATDIAMKIVQQIGQNPDLPDVSVGLATGSVISRLGDVFGPPVNLAARLTSVARSNRVITDKATAALLGEGFVTQVLPERPLRGFGNVEPVTVRRSRPFVSR